MKSKLKSTLMFIYKCSPYVITFVGGSIIAHYTSKHIWLRLFLIFLWGCVMTAATVGVFAVRDLDKFVDRKYDKPNTNN